MGTVWKARDELLGRIVALKVLGDSFSGDPSARRNFRREAEIAARLDHPCIVPVYEAGEFEDVAFLVMKLINGATLEQVIARRLPPEQDVLRWVISVADALEYAHSHSVIHRDITPRNIMLTQSGTVYVLDFGLARVLGATASSTGHVAGTSAYIAPERLGGNKANARSDLFGLGVVMFEALTGTRPFQGERTEVLYYHILSGTPDAPSSLRPELSHAVDAIVLRLLARDPLERPESAHELSCELKRILAATEDRRKQPREVPAAASTTPTDPLDSPVAPSELANRWSSGQARPYLAVLPIEGPADADADPSQSRMLRGLEEAIEAGLADLDRLHVVRAERGPDPNEDPKNYARRVGANLLLRASARFSGSSVRLVYTVIDTERGARIAGGHADGSLIEPFALEDRLVSAVRESLGIRDGGVRNRSLSKPPDPAAAERFSQALTYLRRFDNEASTEGAISLLEGLLASEGESAAIHAAIARASVQKYQQSRQRAWEARAAHACERAIALAPESADVLLAVGELHVAAGRHLEALVDLDRALALQPDFYDAHVARARALDRAGRAGEAEEACRRAIGIDPTDWRGYHVLGLILFRHGRYGEAVAPWTRVTGLTPDNSVGHRNLGSALFHLDRYDDAVTSFRRAIDIRPHGMAFYNLGTVLFILERYDECVEAFEKAVALAPADPWAWGNLGNACRHAPGREGRMREALERAVALMRERLDREPGEGEDLARLAGWLENLGRCEEAEAMLRRALERSPDDIHCMVAAGITLFNLGVRDEALGWIRRAVQSGYGTDSLRRSPELRRLAGDAEFRRILEEGSRASGAAGTNEVQ